MEMKKYKLSEICELNNATLKSSDNIDEILYLDTSNITENCIDELQPFYTKDAPSRAQRKVKDKSIIFSTVRPNQKHFGILNNPPKNLIVSTGFTTLDVKKTDEFDANYVYLKLTQPYIVNHLQTLAQNSVSSYPSINPDDIGNLRFDFPPLPTQQKIADVLSTLDNKIALNHRINAKLEAMAKRLYDYWFVQFDYPDKNGKPYKTSGGKMVWNEVLKREIPVGWEVKLICDITKIFNGSTPSTTEDGNYGGEIVWITPKDLSDQNCKFVYQGARNITKAGYNSCSTTMVPKGTVVMSSRAPIGLLSIAQCELCTNQGFKNMVPNDMTDSKFLYYTIQQHIPQIKNLGTGTTFKEVSKDELGRFAILYPPKKLIAAFEEKVTPIFDTQFNKVKEISRLTKLRDKLLPLLMSGQVVME